MALHRVLFIAIVIRLRFWLTAIGTFRARVTVLSDKDHMSKNLLRLLTFIMKLYHLLKFNNFKVKLKECGFQKIFILSQKKIFILTLPRLCRILVYSHTLLFSFSNFHFNLKPLLLKSHNLILDRYRYCWEWRSLASYHLSNNFLLKETLRLRK